MNTFSKRAVVGLSKIGDIYLPQNGEFPKYSDVADTSKLDMLIENAPKEDIEALNMVLVIFSFLPSFIIKFLVHQFTNAMSSKSDGVVASNLRQLNMGLRGLCYSTYYSEFNNENYKGKTPLQILDYSLNRVED
jgi:hypothetical protein